MPMSRDEMLCETCIFYVQRNTFSGECFLRPPSIVVLGHKAQSIHPETLSNSFCSDGLWEKISEITDCKESYYYSDLSPYSWAEEQVISKQYEDNKEK